MNDPLDSLRSEGDLNLSPRRADWAALHIASETQAILDEDARYFLHQSLSTPCLNAITACDGIYLIDAQGRRIMDFHGNNVHQVGYKNPRVMTAIREQLETLPFCPRRYTNGPAVALAKKLADLAPGDLNKVLFAPGGASAIGIALKLARAATGRFKTVSMWDSFHGASLDAISIAEKQSSPRHRPAAPRHGTRPATRSGAARGAWTPARFTARTTSDVLEGRRCRRGGR